MDGQIKKKNSLNLKCDLAKECRFFQKYKSKKSIVWLGLFSTYCCNSIEMCDIYQNHRECGSFLPSDTLPTGKQVSVAFQSLP